MQDPTQSAHEISEHLLERTGNAIMSDRFPDFLACFVLPYHLETLESSQLISTAPDMEATFRAVRAHLTTHSITLMARHCVSASFRSETEVAATHETRLISRGVLVQQPYPTFSLIRRGWDKKWRIAHSSYVIVDSDPLNAALAPHPQPARKTAT